MKPHVTSDSGLRLTPGRRRLLIVLLLIGLLLALGWALTERAGAAPANEQPARACTAWRFTCTSKWHGICHAWEWKCTQAGKVSGLASMQPAPMPCTCHAGGKSWPCALQFEAYGVKWRRVHVCIEPKSGKVDGLASPLPGNRGGCKASNYWTNISCTVVQAGRGWAFGDCELGYAFSGTTKVKLKAGDTVTVSGCLDDKGSLFDAGRRWPLVIRVSK